MTTEETTWTVPLALVEPRARELARTLSPGTWVLLEGDMGAGKTTLTKFLCAACGVSSDVTSPTFPLLNAYPGEGGEGAASGESRIARVLHLDLYRLRSGSELLYVGLEEMFDARDTLVIIEWPETLSEEEWNDFFATTRCSLPKETVRVVVEHPENAGESASGAETRNWRISRSKGFVAP